MSDRLFRLESHKPEIGPVHPTWNVQRGPRTQGILRTPEPRPMVSQGTWGPAHPVIRDSYAQVTARQPQGLTAPHRLNTGPQGPTTWPPRQATGRDNSTRYNRTDPPFRTQQPRVTTTNLDFWFLVNTLFNLVRLEHHRMIWIKLPMKIGNAMNEFVSMICPPLPNNDWRESMCGLEKDIEQSILQKIHNHFETQKCDLMTSLKNSNPEDLEEAADLAYQRLRNQFGNKIRTKHLNDYLTSIKSCVGASRPPLINYDDLPTDKKMPRKTTNQSIPFPSPVRIPSTSAGIPVVAQNSNPTTSTAKTPRPSETTLKRTLSISPPSNHSADENDSSPVPLSPRNNKTKKCRILSAPCTPVTVGVTDLEMSETQVIDNSNTNTASSPRRAMKNANIRSYLSSTSQSKVTTSVAVTGDSHTPIRSTTIRPTDTTTLEPTGSPTGSVMEAAFEEAFDEEDEEYMKTILHPSHSKQTWCLTPKLGTRVLVLGDSNMKLCIQVQKEYEVHAFSGAHLAHINVLLTETTFPSSIKDIVIAVGINNRDKSFPHTTIHDLRKTISIAKGLKQRIHFVGVSAQNDPSGNIQRLNELASKWFMGNYIVPIPPEEVEILPTDTKFGIHHSFDTVQTVFSHILYHIETLNLL